MNIILAKNIGFCSGVKRALELVENAINKGIGPLYLLGPLVHNKEVMNGLFKKGVKIINSIDKIPSRATIIIPAHGIGPATKKKLIVRGIKLIDATCPQVLKVQRLAQKASKGESVIIFGDRKHREVKGIKGWTKNQARVVSSLEEFKNLNLNRMKKVTLLSQTTQNKEDFAKIANFFKKHFSQTKVYQTICPEILARFEEVKKMAKICDLIIVVGSQSSANTRRLYNLARGLNRDTIWVSRVTELEGRLSKGKDRIGIISGASTPLTTINKLCELLEEKVDRSK